MFDKEIFAASCPVYPGHRHDKLQKEAARGSQFENKRD